MFLRKLFGLGLAAMLIFGLLGLIGAARGSRYDSAYEQGYLAGQQAAAAAEDGGTVTAPVAPRNPASYGHHRGFGFFPGIGVLACLPLLFLMSILFFMFSRKRHRFGPRHWHRHGRKHPWIDDDDDWSDEPVMKA